MSLKKYKECNFRFYQLNVGENGRLSQVREELLDFFKKHSGNPVPTPNEIVDIYKIQLQGITKSKRIKTVPVFSGVVKKFMDTDLPKVGVAGQAAEDDITLKEGESIIRKTYFLYDVSRHILLYQINQYGTSYNRFGEYLETQCSQPLDIKFDPIPTQESYDQFLRGEAELREVSLRIPLPTATVLLKRIKTPWVKDLLNIITGTGGGIDLKLTAKAKHGNQHLERKEGIYELLNCFRELFTHTSDTSSTTVKVKAVNEDGSVHPIDLMMDSILDTAYIPIIGKYMEDDDIIAAMEDSFIKKQGELKEIFDHNQ